MERFINQKRIAYLKQQLKATDYMAIKYGEGEIPFAEYQSIKEQRRKWRTEINALQDLIKAEQK